MLLIFGGNEDVMGALNWGIIQSTPTLAKSQHSLRTINLNSGDIRSIVKG